MKDKKFRTMLYGLGVLIAVQLVIVPALFATVYYVDFAGGSDSNEGISILMPWKHCPGDSVATNRAASATLSPGDAVHFKGGVPYLGNINFQWSGSSGSPIAYDGNSSGSWGAGKAIIDGGDTRLKGFSGSNNSYITINNFEIRNMAYSAGDSQGTGGVYFTGTSTGVTVKNCYIWDIGVWQNEATTNAATISGRGISFEIANNCTVSNNEITKAAVGVEIQGGTYTTVSGNNIHDYVVWGVDVTNDEGYTENITISGNTIHDMYQLDTPYWLGYPADGPHNDYIFIRGPNPTYKGYPKNIIIEKNSFYDNYDHAANDAGVTGVTAIIYLSTSVSNITIRNNVFKNWHSYWAIRAYYSATGTKVYNNTFYNTRAVNAILSTNSSGTHEFKNNIAVGGALFNLNTATGFTADYNIYCGTGSINQNFVVGSSFWTFANWQGNTGQDAHSIFITDISKINFVSTSGFPVASSSMDLSIKSTSQARDAGTALVGISVDINGTSRPQGSGFDIGAYEGTNSGSDPGAPKNVRIP